MGLTVNLDRRDFARAFRDRLAEALDRAGMNRTELARSVGIDRSTLSLLMSEESDRLPRADTAAAIANALQVSLDWLLGLSNEADLGADIHPETMEIAPSSPTPLDERINRWIEEAVGYKIRYVPTTIPDLAKTDAVLQHEYRDFAVKSTGQAIALSQQKLAYARLPETDMEICTPVQAITGFAHGEGMWEGLPLADRLAQLDRLILLVEELYPTLRLYLFDGLTHYSAPYTIFGPKRVALYAGQVYLVFNTREHIRVLTRHFDDLVRAAVVNSAEAGAYLRRLRGVLTGGAGPA
ncbi:MAG: helix-turn-helix transcriptional regulator [Defluviicoccus sp.]|nr:helix-turn-helix transcriptional regulator [Defluviicoccus sp.]MDE0386665.1 helix-turn-helix transcriptional regulator [Defluviicoccus sp.]